MRVISSACASFAVVMLCVALTLTNACDLAAPLHSGDKSLTVDHVAGAPLQVATGSGSIAVTKTDRPDVQIRAKISAVSEDRLAATKIETVRGIDNTLTVRCAWPGDQPQNRESCSFEIEIPDTNGVTLVSENGNLKTSELTGKATLLSTNGNIEAIAQVGPVEAHTTNGTINVVEAGGAVKAATTNGSIDIELARESAGPIMATAVNATIDVSVGPAFAGTLTLGTTNGLVTVDPSVRARITVGDPHEAQLTFGNSDVKSSATTINGTVRVRSTESVDEGT